MTKDTKLPNSIGEPAAAPGAPRFGRAGANESQRGMNAPEAPSPENVSAVWHRTPLRVPLFEVDLGQALYHGNYFHLFELARESFLRDLGYPYRRFMDQQLHLTVVESSCSYRRALRYDDLIEVHTAVSWWRRRSLAFAQVIFRDEGGGGEPVLCTRASLNMVCVLFSGRPSVLPPDFVTLLQGWVSGGV